MLLMLLMLSMLLMLMPTMTHHACCLQVYKAAQDVASIISASPAASASSSVKDWGLRLQQALLQHPMAQQPASAHLAYCSDLLQLQVALVQKLQAAGSAQAQQLAAAKAEGAKHSSSLQQCVSGLQKLLAACNSSSKLDSGAT